MTYESPWLTDDMRMFRSTVRKFLQSEFAPHQGRWSQQRRPDADAWLKAGRAGLLLTDVPEDYGGGGGNFGHQAVVLEELARAGVRFGSIVQSVVAHYVLAYGSEAQKRTWLPLKARGERVAAIAMTEPGAGSDLQSIKTMARRDGDRYVINGSKAFVTNGVLASLVCLAVKTDPKATGMKGISLIMVEPKDLPGYHTGQALHKVGMHEVDTCEMFFDDVRVPTSNLLGPVEGKGYGQILEQLTYERLAVGASAAAMAEHAVSITLNYVKDRRAFGQPLIEFQNTRFKLAECATEAHIGRVFIDSCIQRFISGALDPVIAAMAKYRLTD